MLDAPMEHKYLMHFLDASFGGTTPNYIWIGDDLEEYNEELNPDVEQKKNIKGESRVVHNGYEVSSEVEPFYAYTEDPLGEKLMEIANERKTGSDCMTYKVDVLVNAAGSVVWAYRERVYVIPSSIGGDTSGVQIPFNIYNAGERVKGTWNKSTKAFVLNA